MSRVESATFTKRRMLHLIRQITSFGLIGAVAFVVDIGSYNVLRATVLVDSPIWSKVVSVTVATGVAWLGNRYLTFRGQRSGHAVREGIAFAGVNLVGLLIASACLVISHYGLGLTSQLADNVSGNVVGLVLGTAFRFAAYRWVVFADPRVFVEHLSSLRFRFDQSVRRVAPNPPDE